MFNPTLTLEELVLNQLGSPLSEPSWANAGEDRTNEPITQGISDQHANLENSIGVIQKLEIGSEKKPPEYAESFSEIFWIKKYSNSVVH